MPQPLQFPLARFTYSVFDEPTCLPQVAHTSHLLMQWRRGDDGHSQQLRYAQLESLIDCTTSNPEMQSSDVTSESFKLLPLDAQIQVQSPSSPCSLCCLCSSRWTSPRKHRCRTARVAFTSGR